MMSNSPARHILSFQENVAILFDELQLAIRLERHSLLLGIHRSKPGQEKAQASLAQRLAELDQAAIPVRIRDGQADPAHIILQNPNRDRAVFFVADLAWGGGADGRDAYRALNLYREVFVEQRLRTVFWLTEEEAFHLPRYAPDFWAFRHRVVEFGAPRLARKSALPVGALLWHNQDLLEATAGESGIAYAQQLLAGLPAGPEACSARVEALYTLAFLSWHAGEAVKAEAALRAGMALAEQAQIGDLAPWFLNGLAVLAYEAGQPEQALITGRRAAEHNPQDGVALANLAVIHHALGRRREAIVTGLKAIKTDPGNAKLWGSLANIYIASGMLADAIVALERAVQARPGAPEYRYALAFCCKQTGQDQKAARQIELAGQAGERPSAFHRACAEAISGSPEAAWKRLQSQPGDRQLARNPLVHFLFGSFIG